MKQFFFAFSILIIALIGTSCTEPSSNNANARPAAKEVKCDPTMDTPTEAYKRLFAAVKAKDTAKIRQEMTENTQQFAQMVAERQKKPVDEAFANGFTATTFAPELPQIRDERVVGCFGAIEVRNDKESRWEDLPFMIEGGQWKLAVGETFGGVFQQPGKGQDVREREAANTARGNTAIPNMMSGQPISNVNAASNMNAPKYDGPQVQPLPNKK